MRVAEKTAVITGAGSGIGKASAIAMASQGARIACLDCSQDSAEEVAAAIRAQGGEALSYVCDVSAEDAVQAAVEQVTQKFGPIHVLFANAGIAIRHEVVDEQPADWDRCMAVNVRGIYLAARFCIPHMPPGASIINTSSVVGLTGVRHRAVYSASKGAIIAMTRNMALDYASRGIRVNCVCPGFVRTPLLNNVLTSPERTARLTALHPLGRLGTPEDIANAVLFLASDESSWITGQALAVDGGFTAGHASEI
jgi:NAD(P)-dependent dehydrogenase (short-subunit alcohol dehydrogenase family)